MYSHTPGCAAHAAKMLGLPDACIRADGFVAAGCPLGTEEFVTAHVDGVAQSITERVDKLLSLPVPAQSKLLLLRKSLQSQAHHLARSMASVPVPALRRVEDKITQAMFDMLSRDRAACPEAEEQMKLPPRMGGMGVHSLTAQEGLPCDAAFLAQAALTQRAVAGGNTRFNPFTGPMREILEDVLAADP